MKKILLSCLISMIVILGTVGCGNSKNEDGGSSAGGSSALYKTVAIEDLNKAWKENDNYYKEYIGKKIKVTGGKVDGSGFITTDKFQTVSISCNNRNSLNLKEGEIVSVTGVVGDLTTQMLMYMDNCTIEK